jgi:hypothetical protein
MHFCEFHPALVWAPWQLSAPERLLTCLIARVGALQAVQHEENSLYLNRLRVHTLPGASPERRIYTERNTPVRVEKGKRASLMSVCVPVWLPLCVPLCVCIGVVRRTTRTRSMRTWTLGSRAASPPSCECLHTCMHTYLYMYADSWLKGSTPAILRFLFHDVCMSVSFYAICVKMCMCYVHVCKYMICIYVYTSTWLYMTWICW